MTGRALAAGPWLLVLLVFATRLPLMTETLYAFDSANFALAIRDGYNVAFHRPHPPGYPLYVAFGWVINLLVHDPNRALVLESVLLSALAVASTTALATALYGRVTGLLAGTLLVFTVGFWGYGEVAYAYVGLAAEVSTLALLALWTLRGRHWAIVALGLAEAIALGIRWDGAIFGGLLWLWALAVVSWRLRILSLLVAGIATVAMVVPMVALSGGLDSYLKAVNEYLQVWSPQSGFVPGEVNAGQATQVSYNLNFFVDYSRQMLGVGILLIFYVLGRRFAPSVIAADYRSRFVLLWTLPPIAVYILAHLGEPGYVLALAPQAATLVALGIVDIGGESRRAALVLRARGWRWLPDPKAIGLALAGVLVLAIVGWNIRAFTNGVGPGRLPDLRTRDATTMSQVQFVQKLPPATTLVLAHDALRQAEYYLLGYGVKLLYSEYVPDWERLRTQTALEPGATQVVVLDSPLEIAPESRSRVSETVLRESPRVSVWVVDVHGAKAVEHGYRWLRVIE